MIDSLSTGILDSLSTSILDSLASGVLAVDLDSRVLFVSASLCRRLGIVQDTWIGKPASGIFGSANPRISPKRSALYRLDPRRDGKRTEYREIEWSDGQRIVHFREDSSPLYNRAGQLIGRLFAYHDLSWEKTVDQMKSEFISIASHELRTPMTSIKGSVDLILGGCAGPVSPETLELLEITHSACDRMIRLINNILDLSKIEAGQIQLNLERLDLTAVVERAMRALEPLAMQAGITLKSNFPADIPCVEGDRDRMEQVITNLVSNAIKFSPNNGEVRIDLVADDEWVRCSVTDQGCGIEEKDLSRIFGKFQQAGQPKRGTGTGLGLAITHALVTEHKGKIWVESQFGRGSSFTFCLPVSSRQA
jgi:signal transduction histidine kinase